MTSTQLRNFVAAGKALSTRIAVSAMIAGAATVGIGAGAASAVPCINGCSNTGENISPINVKTSSATSVAAVAQQSTARVGRGTAGAVVGSLKPRTGCSAWKFNC